MVTINVQDWSPHMSSILKGSQIWALQLKGVGSNPRRRSKNIELKFKTHIKFCAWIMRYMFPVQYEELRIPPSTLLLVVTMSPTLVGSCNRQIILRTSSDVFIFNLGLHFDGLFWERHYILKGPNRILRALKTSILTIGRSWDQWSRNFLGIIS